MALPPSFATSAALRGFRPNLIDTQQEAAAPTVAATGGADLTNRLLQIMGGNLSGTLTGGEKLSALGALLKSVSRGSQTSPQDVMRSIQQQKLQEVQGALQIQELRKQAMQQANVAQIRENLLANAKTEGERDRIRLLDAASLQQYALKGLEEKAPDMEAKERQLAVYYRMRETDPQRASVYWRQINPTQIIGTIESGFKKYDAPEPPIEGKPASAPSSGAAPTSGLTELTAPQPKPVVPTESENQAGFLYTRLQDSLGSMKNILKSNRDAAIPSASEILTQNVFGEDIANRFKSPERQQFIASQRDALAASLTLVTGAAYNEQQLNDEYRAYFPQYNDAPETIQFKARKWDNLLKAAKLKAGRAVQGQSGGKADAPKPSGTKTFTIDGKQYNVSPKG